MPSKLFLIDGHALIFKMYYAFLRRPMVNSKGEDMSVLYGVTKYILELVSRWEPTHLAVAFDPPGGSFRNVMYPDYKATRAATPQLVIDSLEPLTGLCNALGIPVLMKSGYEADDVIGTVAKKLGSEDLYVYMVTPDKDYGQLIDEHIFQLKPSKGNDPEEVVDAPSICAKYGIDSPSQVVEMLAICGDTADNVPGVKGVGEVGASKLISKYGSVEEIYRNLEELSPRQKAQFEEAKPHMRLSHELVTINTGVPIDVSLEDMALTLLLTPEVNRLFRNYEFPSLLKYLKQGERTASVEGSREGFKVEVVGVKEILEVTRESRLCAIVVDGEDGLVSRITLGAISKKGGRLACECNLSEAKPLLEDETTTKCGYSLKTQCNLLLETGVELKGKLLDVELMHYVLNPERSHKLEALSKTRLGIDLEEDNEGEENLLFSEATPSEKSRTKEACVLLLLSQALQKDLGTLEELYWTIEEPLIRVLSKMERDGVKVDLGQLSLFARGLRQEMEEYESRIKEIAEDPSFNPSSPKQVGELVFEKLKLDPKAKKSSRGSWSTDEETLAALSDRHPVVDMILEYRGLRKLLGTYIEPFPKFISPKDGKVHTNFNQALTSTGRLSSSNPNLQNIPIRTDRGREIRKAFVSASPGGVVLSADYSQIELRIMAHLSCDEHLIQAFRRGEDIHQATAAKIFGIPLGAVSPEQRRIAKTANFGIMYGISTFGLAQRLKISRGRAKKIIDDYFEAFPAIQAFISDAVTAAKENGYVETLFGRRRYIPEIKAGNANLRAMAERNAVNAPIQGTAADIIKLAMIGVDREMTKAGLRSRMVLQIHDELLFDVLPEEVEELRNIVTEQMEGVVDLSVPLTVECNYGQNWLEAH